MSEHARKMRERLLRETMIEVKVIDLVTPSIGNMCLRLGVEQTRALICALGAHDDFWKALALACPEVKESVEKAAQTITNERKD